MAFFGNVFPFLDPNNLGAFFHYDEEAAVRAAMEASMRDQQQPARRGPPPASARAVRSLPHIRITSQDLVDPVNRECCICLEAHTLHDTAVRLPCAHIFHADCIQHWLLSSHCTCPVCRYELPTQDAAYETGRIERMKQRKPRFARHELDRLPLKRLKELLIRQQRQQQNSTSSLLPFHPIDRQDLIDYLIKSDAIEIIATPEPVEYSLQALQNMTVSQLRQCMNDEAGVFFDPKDVVEKQDMIRIFLSSGRLSVLPDENPSSLLSSSSLSLDNADANDKNYDATGREHENMETKPSAVPRRPIVETVTDESSTDIDERTNRDLVMEETEYQQQQQQQQSEGDVSSSSRAQDTTTGAETTIDPPLLGATDEAANPSTIESSENVEMNDTTKTTALNAMATGSTTSGFIAAGLASEPVHATHNDGSNSAMSSSVTESVEPTTLETASSYPSFSTEDDDEEEESSLSRRGRKRPLHAAPVQSGTLAGGDGDTIQSRFDTLSVSELRDMGRTLSIDLSDCVERREMIRRLSSGECDSLPSLGNDGLNREVGEPLEASLFQEWSASDFRIGARLVKIDLYQATTREEMAQAIGRGMAERPHAGRFLKALVPFIGLSVSQLKAAAREMRVNLSGCVEKDDILSRIVEHSIAQS